MRINSFEDILSWKLSKELCVEIYEVFKPINDRGFKDQIQRASVSMMNNIAEGFERHSNNELRQFLYIAKGSSGEVRSMLILGKELKYINPEKSELMVNKSIEISKLLSGFIKTL